MKKAPLYVKTIEIYLKNAEELENLTDPNLHNTPISNLILKLKIFKISAKTIENLKAIYPKLITLCFYDPHDKDVYAYKSLFENFTKLLSNLDQTSLVMGYN